MDSYLYTSIGLKIQILTETNPAGEVFKSSSSAYPSLFQKNWRELNFVSTTKWVSNCCWRRLDCQKLICGVNVVNTITFKKLASVLQCETRCKVDTKLVPCCLSLGFSLHRTPCYNWLSHQCLCLLFTFWADPTVSLSSFPNSFLFKIWEINSACVRLDFSFSWWSSKYL